MSSVIQQKKPSPEDTPEPANAGEPIEAGFGGKGRFGKARSEQMHPKRQAKDHRGLRAVGDEFGDGLISNDEINPAFEPLKMAIERYDPSNIEKNNRGFSASSKKNAISRRWIAGVSRIAQKNQTASDSSSRRAESRNLGLDGASTNGSDGNIARSQAGPKTSRDLNKDLSELEADNRHLKKLLADKLRRENAELKRKLGFAVA